MTASSIILLTGGVRAGKSARAVALANERRGDGRVLFVATAQACDDEMHARIEAHRRERPHDWETLESPIELTTDIETHLDVAGACISVVVIDCLTLWVSNVLLSLPDDAPAQSVLAARVRSLLDVLHRARSSGTTAVVVTNEVGLGVIPATVLGRRYSDALGRVNQVVAAEADEVTLMVAGLPLPLKTTR